MVGFLPFSPKVMALRDGMSLVQPDGETSGVRASRTVDTESDRILQVVLWKDGHTLF